MWLAPIPAHRGRHRPRMFAAVAVLVLVIGVVVVVAVTRSDQSPEKVRGGEGSSGPNPSVTSQDLRIERTLVGPHSRVDDVATTADGTVVALASTAVPFAADTAFVSVDKGRTWSRHDTGLHGSGPVGAHDGSGIGGSPQLLVAGNLLVASSTPPTTSSAGVGEGATPRTQQLASSNDGGRTWQPLQLPAPQGITPIALADIAQGDTMLLVGTLQRDDAVANFSTYGVPYGAYDAGAWRSTDGGRTFRNVSLPASAAGDGAQILSRLLPNGDRIVVVGSSTALRADGSNLSYTNLTLVTSDGGATWSMIGGGDLAHGGEPFWLRGDDITQGTPGDLRVLAPGAPAWESEQAELPVSPTQRGFQGFVQGTAASTGNGSVLTWVEDSACDCEIAEAGRYLDPSSFATTTLPFEGCRDTSVRGETWVGQPVRLDRLVAAPAACNDDGWMAGAVAVTADDGSTWATDRLDQFAPSGYDHVVFPRAADRGRFAVTVDGALIVIAQGARGVRDIDRGYLEAPAGPLVFFRVTAADR